jgi:TetR/AcrR family transcriptional regulator of autoinduction and epiphytic fitness
VARSVPEALPLTDGRAARSHRTRLAILDSLLRLLSSGDLRPTTERIASAAGVSTRSIFLHFADVDSLFTQAVDCFAERMLDGVRPVDPQGPLSDRVEEFSRQRARMYESMAPAARAAQIQEPFSVALADRMRALRRRSREATERVFGPELDVLGAEERRELVEALTAIASFTQWDGLRRYQGLSRARAEKVLRRSLAALLGAASE